eukprot:PhF_6_TR13397/c0_g1_i1/m.21288
MIINVVCTCYLVLVFPVILADSSNDYYYNEINNVAYTTYSLSTSYPPTGRFYFFDELRIPLNPNMFWLPVYTDKNIIGVSVEVLGGMRTPSVCIENNNSTLTRFIITGNDTTSFRLETKDEVQVSDIRDIYDVVKSVHFRWGENESVSKGDIVQIKWTLLRVLFDWCTQCHAFIRWSPIITYSGISETQPSKIMYITGLTIENPGVTAYLVNQGREGMVCGSYNVETVQWEWGCYPVAKKRINYTNWAIGEPKYENDTACVYVQLDGTWRVTDCDVISKGMRACVPILSAGPVAGLITLLSQPPPRLPQLQQPPNDMQFLTVNVTMDPSRVLIPSHMFPSCRNMTDDQQQIVFYMEDDTGLKPVRRTCNDFEWDHNKVLSLLKTRGDHVTVTMYWAVHDVTTGCPYNADTVIDPVRGICYQTNYCDGMTNRAVYPSIVGPYDMWLFTNNSNYESFGLTDRSRQSTTPTAKGKGGPLRLCSVGDGSGLYLWGCAPYKDIPVDAYPMWYNTYNTSAFQKSEPSLYDGCVVLHEGVLRTYECNDSRIIRMCGYPLKSSEYGVINVTFRLITYNATTKPPRLTSLPRNIELSAVDSNQVDVVHATTVASVVMSSSTNSLLMVSVISLINDVCNLYSPSDVDQEMAQRLNVDARSNTEYQHFNLVMNVLIQISTVVFEGVLLLLLVYVGKHSLASSSPPCVSLYMFLYMMPTFVSSSLYLGVSSGGAVSSSWVWVLVVVSVGVLCGVTYWVVRYTTQWVSYSHDLMEWADTQPASYAFYKKYGMLIKTYRPERLWFIVVDVVVAMSLSVLCGVYVDDRDKCVGVHVSQAVILCLHTVLIVTFRPSGPLLTHVCDCISLSLFASAMIVRCVNISQLNSLDQITSASKSSGELPITLLVFFGTLLTCVPLLYYLMKKYFAYFFSQEGTTNEIDETSDKSNMLLEDISVPMNPIVSNDCQPVERPVEL